VLAIKYSRSAAKLAGEGDVLDTKAFWKRHTLEVGKLMMMTMTMLMMMNRPAVAPSRKDRRSYSVPFPLVPPRSTPCTSWRACRSGPSR
jgi:hypothetical protein